MKIRGLKEAYARMDEIVPGVMSLFVWYNSEEEAIETHLVMSGNWMSLPEYCIRIGEFMRKPTNDYFSEFVEFVLGKCNKGA